MVTVRLPLSRYTYDLVFILATLFSYLESLLPLPASALSLTVQQETQFDFVSEILFLRPSNSHKFGSLGRRLKTLGPWTSLA